MPDGGEAEEELAGLESVLQRRLGAWRWQIRAEVMDEVAEHCKQTAADIVDEQHRMTSPAAAPNPADLDRVVAGKRYQQLEGAAATRATLQEWAEERARSSAEKAEKANRTADAVEAKSARRVGGL